MNSEVHELTTFELDSVEQKKSGLFSKFFQRFRTSISNAPESSTNAGAIPVAPPSSSSQDQYMTFQEYAAARDDDYRSLNRSRKNSSSNPSAAQMFSPYIKNKNTPYMSGSAYSTTSHTNSQRHNSNTTTGSHTIDTNYTQNVIATSTIINGNSNAPDSSASTPNLTNADPETPTLGASSMNRRPSVSSIASVNTESSAIVPSWNNNNNNNHNTINNHNLRSSTSNSNSKSRLLNHVPHFSSSVFNPGTNNANGVNTKSNPTSSLNSSVQVTASNTTTPSTMTLLSSTQGNAQTNQRNNHPTSVNSKPAFFASNIRNFPSKNYSPSNVAGNNNSSAGSQQPISTIHSKNKTSVGTISAVGSYSNSSISSNATRYSTSNATYVGSVHSTTSSNTIINSGNYHSKFRIRTNSGSIPGHRRKSSNKSDVTLAESLAMSGPTTISTTNRSKSQQRTFGAVTSFTSPNQNFTNSNGTEVSLRRSNSRSSIDSVTSQSSNPDNKRSMKLISMLKSGESKQYWMQDENCKQCYECKINFNTFRRKHHCRICGQIFCYKCASATISGEKFGYSGTLRVCNYCLKLTQNYRNEQNRSHESYPASASLASSLTYTVPKTPPIHTSSSNLSIKNAANISNPSNNPNNVNGVENSWTSKYYSISPDPSYQEQIKRNKSNNSTMPPYPVQQAHLVRSKSSLVAMEDMENSMNMAPFTNKDGPKSINANNDTMDQDIVPYITDENGDVVIAGEEDVVGEVVDEEWIQSPILSYISSTMMAGANKILNTTVDDAISNPGTPLPSEYYSSDEEDSDLISVKSMTSINKLPLMVMNKSRDDLHIAFLKNQQRKKASVKAANRTPKFVNALPNNASTDDLSKILFKPNNPAISYVLPVEEMNLEEGALPYASNLPTSISDPNFNYNTSLMSPHLLNSPTTELIASNGHQDSFILPLNIELSSESYFHMKHLLYQTLYENNCDLNQGWEEILSHILLKVCDNIRPNINRGDDIDIRKYIKIKKIPGGVPSDSHYVQGIVCSKNVAHKKMVRTIKNPRILLLSFSLEYQRVENQFMSLEPILSQEREHLRILIQRIKNLNPDIVLVEKIISRIALEYLLEANIVAVYNVKPSVMQYIARYTQADILNSIDKLVLEPKLGTCGIFSVKTFLNDLIPGKKKTFLFFDGCPRDLGGTIVLRGGEIETLKKIKMITKFIAFVVYNLKLETYLMRDEFAMSPEKYYNSCYHFIKKVLTDKYAHIKTESELDEHFIASSPSSHLLTTIGATGNATTVDDNYSNMENPTSELVETDATSSNTKTDDDCMSIPYSSDIDIIDNENEEGQYTKLYKIFSTRILSCSPHVIFPPPYLITKKMKEEVNYFHELKKQHAQVSETNSLVSATVSPMSAVKEEISNDEIFITNNYINKFKNTNLMNPFGHLSISYLYRSCITGFPVPCELIKMVKCTYYSKSDQTLGQYLEGICKHANDLCQVCMKPLCQHKRTFINGNAKVTVVMEDMECPAEAMENMIIMWSQCKICQQVIPFVPMSEETWMFSFGKYLELAFYHSFMSSRANSCPHNIVKNHIRCFGYQNKVIKFEYNPIELFEVSLPPIKIKYRPEANLKNKQNDVNTIKQYITKYYNSVSERIKNIYLKYVPSSKLQEAKEEIAGMNRRIVVEKAQMLELLQHTAFASTPADVLSLNNVVHVLQEKISEYDNDFEAFSQKYFQLDREFNKRIQLKHAFVTKNDYMTVGRDDSTDPMMKPSRDISISFPELGNSPSQSSPLQSIVNHNESLEGVKELMKEKEENANANANVTENDNNIEFDLEMGKLDAKDAVEEDEEEDEIESMNDRNELDEEEGEDGDDEEEEEEDEKVVESKEDVKRNSLHKFNMKSLTTNKLRKMKINKARRSRSRSLLINHSGGRFDNDPYSYGRIQMLLMENSFSPFKDHPFFNGKHKLKSISSVFGSPVDSNYLFMNVIKNDDNNDDNNIAPVEIDKNLLTFKDDDDKKENTSLKINTNITNFSHLIDDALPIISDSLNNANSEDVGIEPESIIMEKKNSMNESLMILPGSPQRVKTDPTLDTSSIYSKNTFLESDAKSHDQKFQMDDDAEQNSPLLEMEYIDSLLVSETADNATTIMSDIRPSMPNPTTSVFLRTNSIHKLKRTNSVKEQRVKMDLENGNRFDSRHDKPENEENILTSPPLSLTDRNSKDNNLALTSLEYDLPLDITDVISVTPLTYNNESDNETDTEIEKMSIMKTLSQFWTNSSHFSPLDYPFPPDQHIFRGSLVIVREDEPSSVIAFALNSREYRNSLLQQQQQFQPQSLPRRHNNSIHSVGHNGSIINALTSYATTTSVNSAVDSENLNTPVSAVTNGSNVNTTNGSTNLVETQNSALPTHSNASGIVNDDNVPDEENTTRGVTESNNDENKVHKIIDEIIGNHNGTSNNSTDTNNNSNVNNNLNNTNNANGILSEEDERPNNDNESIYKSKTDNHIKCQFMDGSTRIFCKIFYPEKFENLRKNCGVDKIYIQSLSHCLKWSNDGGKSGSAFLKTRDDRFIVKQLSRPEMDAFLKFADEYFEYLNNVFYNKTPTSLAKIYGIYRFGIKNPNSGKNIRMDVLVMENLFYGHKCSKIFDLKGSTRNRHAQSTGKENEVLLDENLLELINEQPLYIREYSKNLLFTSVWKDTSFLSQLNVMDYSLVVGVDNETQELITGIVDYIRTFTWDKKLESWVKETGILGGGGKDPTIISPVQYKNRFRESMARYFLMVPDKFCFEDEEEETKLEK